ncbi:MAG: hypothetical protein ACKVOM_10985 [Ferruginibacter sp.]
MKARFLLAFLTLFYWENIVFAQDTIPIKRMTKEEMTEEARICHQYFVSKLPTPINFEEIQQLIEPIKDSEGKIITNEILLRIEVSKEGKYIRHIVCKNSNDILLQRIENQITKLIYEPAMQRDKPIKFWVMIKFTFK